MNSEYKYVFFFSKILQAIPSTLNPKPSTLCLNLNLNTSLYEQHGT